MMVGLSAISGSGKYSIFWARVRPEMNSSNRRLKYGFMGFGHFALQWYVNYTVENLVVDLLCPAQQGAPSGCLIFRKTVKQSG
jgi:hypothetical protein